MRIPDDYPIDGNECMQVHATSVQGIDTLSYA